MKYKDYNHVNELFVRTDDYQEKTVIAAMTPAVAYDINMLKKLFGKDNPKLQEVIEAIQLANTNLEEMKPMLNTIKAFNERKAIVKEADKKINEAIPSLINAINEVVQRGMRSFVVLGERLKLIDTATKTEITKVKPTAFSAIEVWARHKSFTVDEFVDMLVEHFATIGNQSASTEVKDFLIKIKAKEIELEKVYKTQVVSYDVDRIAGATGEPTIEVTEGKAWDTIKMTATTIYYYIVNCIGSVSKWSDSIKASENDLINEMS